MKLSAVIIRLALNTMVAAAIAFAIVGSSNCCAAATNAQNTNNDRNDDESIFIRLALWNKSFFLRAFILLVLPLFHRVNGRRMGVDLIVYVGRLVRGWLGERVVDLIVHVGRCVGRLLRGWVVVGRLYGRLVETLAAPVGNGPQVGVIQLPNRAEVNHDTITNIGGECIICNVNKAICVTWPCAHISYCVGCALIVGGGQHGNNPQNIGQLQCSLCQVDITEIKRAFFP